MNYSDGVHYRWKQVVDFLKKFKPATRRIQKTPEGKFVPQIRMNLDGWHYIGKDGYAWLDEKYIAKYATYDNIEEAERALHKCTDVKPKMVTVRTYK